MSMVMNDSYLLPGITAIRETQEKNFIWDPGLGTPVAWKTSEVLLSSTVDAGNTPTTMLRPGLLLGKVTATGKIKEWNPTGTDGSETVYGVLAGGQMMLDGSATAADRWLGYIVVAGPVKMAGLLVPGQSSYGLSATPAGMLAMAQMRGRFVFDSQLANGGAFLSHPRREVIKTADYSVVEADNGSLFTNTGATTAITFTLPALTNAVGLCFEFFVTADYGVTIASAAANGIIGGGSDVAESFAFNLNPKIGGHARVWCSPNSSKWFLTNLSTGIPGTLTY